MKITANAVMNLKNKEVKDKVNNATKKTIVMVITLIANTAIKEHSYKDITGNNTRSLKFEVGPNGEVAKGELEGAFYSTSGYGGYIETGTVKMDPRPYMKPALDRHIHKLPDGIKAELK